jgi:hypothetical protein
LAKILRLDIRHPVPIREESEAVLDRTGRLPVKISTVTGRRGMLRLLGAFAAAYSNILTIGTIPSVLRQDPRRLNDLQSAKYHP